MTAGSPVERWFGSEFERLHPLLQQLHRHGGTLVGSVRIKIPRGLAGVVGRRLARRLGVPIDAPTPPFRVAISHRDGRLHWQRCFGTVGEGTRMLSIFEPLGTRAAGGCWRETTGALSMRLTVDVIDGAWHWRALAMRWRGVPLPVALFPRSTARKRIVDGRYEFFVGFRVPGLGEVLSYGGLLDALPSAGEA